MNHPIRSTLRPALGAAAVAAALLLALGGTQAFASEALYRDECGDCHLAYPARLLPADIWRKVIGGLERHFGVDASLDPATATAIEAWLVSRSGRDERHAAPGSAPAKAGIAPRAPGSGPVGDPALRITTSRWFVREHDELPPSTWRRPAIGSPANCAACHTDAAAGRFGEHALRIPR